MSVMRNNPKVTGLIGMITVHPGDTLMGANQMTDPIANVSTDTANNIAGNFFIIHFLLGTGSTMRLWVNRALCAFHLLPDVHLILPPS